MVKNKKIIVKPIAKSPIHDFAVLESDFDLSEYPKLQIDSTYNIGDKVYAIGYPYGYERLLTEGIVSGHTQEIETFYLNRIISTTPLLQGNSGGPLFNTKGHVVGIALALISRVNSTTSLNLFMNPSEIILLYNRVLNNKSLEQKISYTINYTKILNDKNNYFTFDKIQIKSDTPSLNLKQNDIIISINGVDIKTENNFVNSLYYLFIDDPLNIVVLRNSEKIRIDIP
jgi:serine protease Do